MWPWSRIPKVSEPSQPDNLVSIGDPAVAGYFGVGPTLSNVNVNETTSLGLSAVYRACSLISGTIGGLPLKTYRNISESERQGVKSVLDNPGKMWGIPPYVWKQVIVVHLLLHGRAPLQHFYNQGGGLIGLLPIHPLAAPLNEPLYNEAGRRLPKTCTVTTSDGRQKKLTEGVDLTDILGFSVDGYHGKGVITVARESLGAAIAGDRAAANMFGNGFLQSGLVTPEEDVDEEDGKKIKESLNKRTAGWEHAGELAFVNRKLKVQPWTMTARDAQFLESRQFSIEEIARWFGVPPFELMQTEKQTSWGTGIEAQQRGLARGNLLGWTMRIEEYLSILLAEPRFCEFDFAGMERPTPEQEIRLLIEQVNAGLITVNEARKIRNLPPLAGGDTLRSFGNPIQSGDTQEDTTNDVINSARRIVNDAAEVLS